MNKNIDLIQLATMNTKLNLEILRFAEKTVREVNMLGVKMDPEYSITGPFESKKATYCRVSEEE